MPTFRAIALAGAVLLLTGCGSEADKKAPAKDAAAPAAADAQLAALDGEVARLQTLAAGDKQAIPEVLKAESIFVAARDKCRAGAEAKACLVPLYAARAHALREASAGARAEDPKSISIGPLPLKCDGIDALISVSYLNSDPGVAHLAWGGDKSVTLTQEVSASGAKYGGKDASGVYSFWTKGDEAMLTRPGATETKCKFEPAG